MSQTEPLAGRRVLITGASKGLGLALTHALVDRGCEVYALARSTQTLEGISGVTPLAVDLTDPDAVRAVADGLGEKAIDTLILNAGTCEYIDVEHFDRAPFDRVFDLNLGGNLNALQSLLPALRRSEKAPHIVGISSLVTLLPLTRSQAYGASKAAMDYLLASSRVDLYRYGVDVTVVKPGFIKTPLTDRNDFPMPYIMEPERAAEHVLKAIAGRRTQYAFPWQMRLGMKAIGLLPEKWQVKMMQKTLKERG